jgi:hypothetical protein
LVDRDDVILALGRLEANVAHIKEQVDKLPPRITELERWQTRMKGSLSVLFFMITASLSMLGKQIWGSK